LDFGFRPTSRSGLAADPTSYTAAKADRHMPAADDVTYSAAAGAAAASSTEIEQQRRRQQTR